MENWRYSLPCGHGSYEDLGNNTEYNYLCKECGQKLFYLVDNHRNALVRDRESETVVRSLDVDTSNQPAAGSDPDLSILSRLE